MYVNFHSLKMLFKMDHANMLNGSLHFGFFLGLDIIQLVLTVNQETLTPTLQTLIINYYDNIAVSRQGRSGRTEKCFIKALVTVGCDHTKTINC